MKRYATRRLLQMVPVILLITFGVASLMRLVPGDPTTLALGQAATDADREKFREANHLNDSLPEQYLRWWGDVFHGNLGNSVVSRDNVTDELKQRLPSTLELLIFSLVLTVIIGIPLGILSAIRQNSVSRLLHPRRQHRGPLDPELLAGHAAPPLPGNLVGLCAPARQSRVHG